MSEILGTGAYSVVVRDGDTAIKQINMSEFRIAMREIVLMSICRSAHTIGLYRVEIHRNHIALVMPYYERTLGALVGKFSDSLESFSTIICDIARGIAYLHAHGVIHCDIKPSNILLTEDGRAVLADYGLSTIDREHRHMGDVVTYSYRAPEIRFIGRRDVYGLGIDIWSYGCVIIEMITGRPPMLYGRTDVCTAEAWYRYFGGVGTQDDYCAALREISDGTRADAITAITGGRWIAISGFIARCMTPDVSRRPSAIDTYLAIMGMAGHGRISDPTLGVHRIVPDSISNARIYWQGPDQSCMIYANIIYSAYIREARITDDDGTWIEPCMYLASTIFTGMKMVAYQTPRAVLRARVARVVDLLFTRVSSV